MASAVGEAVIKLSLNDKEYEAKLSQLDKQTSSALSKLSKTSDDSTKKLSAGFTAATGIITAAASKAFNTVTDVISNSMSSAVARVDTLNNFPLVMQSLGYSADEASSSISAISAGLDGLPTSLDEAVSNVQLLSSTMGNLNQGTVNATTVGLAFNNMMLAGGGGTQAASNALTQYNQMLAAGRVDQQAWNSLLTAAPGQLNQVAQSLLGASAGQKDLYEAMKSGTISFDQFNEAIVKLNTEGGEGFSSFEDQARAATGGIGTAMENVQNRATKAVGSVIQAIGSGEIANSLNNISSQFGVLGDAIGKALNGEDASDMMTGFIENMGSALKTGISSLISSLGTIGPILVEAIIGIIPDVLDGLISGFTNMMYKLAEAIPGLLTVVVNAVIKLAELLTNPDMISNLISAAITLLMAIVDAIPQIIPPLVAAIPMIINNIITAFKTAFPQILNGAIQLFLALVQALPDVLQALSAALPEIITTLIAFLTDPNTIMMLIQASIQLFFALVQAVPQILGALIGAFGTLVGSLWEAIKGMFGKFAANFGEFIGNIFKNAINGVLGFIENIINGPINIINGFIDMINGAFGFIGVNLGRIDTVSLPRLAQGGLAYGATTAVIGEAGTEAVLPLQRNTDNWSGLLADTLLDEIELRDESFGNGVNVTQNVYINNEMDAEDIGRKLMTSIRRAA